MIKITYWTIATLVIFVSTFHYSEVFRLYEHEGILGIIVSWSMGIIFDAGLMLYMYMFARIKSLIKYPTMLIFVAFTFFFQFEYYNTIQSVWKRVFFSVVFPFMIVILAFISKTINAKQDDHISDDEKELQRILGKDYQHQQKLVKKKLKKYECPGCGNTYDNYHKLNAHRPNRCVEKRRIDNEKNN